MSGWVCSSVTASVRPALHGEERVARWAVAEPHPTGAVRAGPSPPQGVVEPHDDTGACPVAAREQVSHMLVGQGHEHGVAPRHAGGEPEPGVGGARLATPPLDGVLVDQVDAVELGGDQPGELTVDLVEDVAL